MASVTITWQTVGDDKVCPVCKALEGHQWTFPVGEGGIPNELTAEPVGTVWDVASGSQTHGHKGNCRCSLQCDLDLHDILVKLEAFYEALVAAKEGTGTSAEEGGGETSAAI